MSKLLAGTLGLPPSRHPSGGRLIDEIGHFSWLLGLAERTATPGCEVMALELRRDLAEIRASLDVALGLTRLH